MKIVSRSKVSTLAFILLIGILITCCFGFASELNPKSLQNKSAPSVSNVSWNSGSYTVPTKNSVNVVVFWNSKYKSAIDALVSIESIYSKFKSSGLKVYGINDSDESKIILNLIALQNGISYPLGTGSGSTNAASSYAIRGVPVAFLVDKTGKIVDVFDGYSSSDANSLIQAIQKII